MISAILVFGVFYCIGMLSLSLFGKTTTGIIDSYANRRVNAKDYSDRMRSITKTYHFYVGGRRYSGFASYLSGEIKAVVVGREDEPNRELIRYMPALPYMNSPAHLTDLDFWGVLYYCAAIPICALLLLLTNGWTFSKAKTEKEGKRKRIMVRGEKAYVLRGRGALAGKADLPPQGNATGLVGWSSRCSDAEILAAAQSNRRTAMGCAWALAFLFPIGFAIAGLLIEELPLGEALVIGSGLGILMMAINLLRVKSMRKPVWEGIVTEKSQKDRRKYDRLDNAIYYTEFVLVIQPTTGRTHRIARKQP